MPEIATFFCVGAYRKNWAGVCHVRLPAQHHAVLLSDGVVDPYVEVRKSAPKMLRKLSKLFQINGNIVQHLTLSYGTAISHLINDLKAALVPQFVEPTMRQGYVLFSL